MNDIACMRAEAAVGWITMNSDHTLQQVSNLTFWLSRLGDVPKWPLRLEADLTDAEQALTRALEAVRGAKAAIETARKPVLLQAAE